MAASINSCFSHKMNKIVVILGATGTGKSKLAIQIAKHFGGEIISADSMQVYKSLDIITNKVTTEEQRDVKHHLIDFVDPLKSITVKDFRKLALPIIESLSTSGKIPIIVGGTNYYIESLLWDVLIEPDNISSEHYAESEEHSKDSTAELYKRLKDVDPERASSIHPNDRRKICTSLRVYERLKRPHSEFIRDQMERSGGENIFGGPLRFPHAHILWLQCDQKVLEERLEQRVDEMLDAGLIREMLDFHEAYNRHRLNNNITEPNYTTGIFQSIGFKEFHDYLMLSEEERESEKGKKIFQHDLWLMKQVTKRYSRYQKKWINKRFLGEPSRPVPPIYPLDATDPLKWEENVWQPTERLLSCVLRDLEPTKECVKPLEKFEHSHSDKKQYVCDDCGITVIGHRVWMAHVNSRRHHKRQKSIQEMEHRNSHQTSEVGVTA